MALSFGSSRDEEEDDLGGEEESPKREKSADAGHQSRVRSRSEWNSLRLSRSTIEHILYDIPESVASKKQIHEVIHALENDMSGETFSRIVSRNMDEKYKSVVLQRVMEKYHN
ncbi:MAG: hypothetical protein G01um101418_690 [Parcubacteria group bacterium Gr01-1014_18]|nr:MAG: hypothetical protein Greene041636_856 [Parcubacteria group bacterium Greene0416_36]TSC80271.1 MAG: hypothetical protein G01um101418_690 [Parcubacteria group bacterium Gr01-1014_18]TSC98250.1 MAG: hypothetical protein Greene101420_843 [Parcubacteria group bacterium Greene1014_20]TSD07007.1 MAG: hypothetical protein Greene07142_464 [Parcubacteria group bacterium Greene0714_2]